MAFAIGCSEDAGTNDPPIPDKPTDQAETVTVSFAMKGDVSIEETPLITKAAGEETESKDLYGIIVYYDADQSGKIDDYYGEGFFDNINDMTISLITGYKYQFICTLIKNGKDILQHTDNVSFDKDDKLNHRGYLEPFGEIYHVPAWEWKDSYDGWKGVEPKNEFMLGTKYGLSIDRLRSGYALCRYKSGIYGDSYPCTDRYYGEVTDYSPKDNSVVNIDMKRCVFGVKIVVAGIADGSFSFYCSNLSLRSGKITSDTTFMEKIYTYQNVYDCWKSAMTDVDFSEDFDIQMTWERGNGVTQNLTPLSVTFKRNVLTTVNIRLNGGDTDNSFNLNVENTEMEEANTDFTIDGEMTDTPINPTE